MTRQSPKSRRFSPAPGPRFNAAMATRSRMISTDSDLPKIRQPTEPVPSTINEKTVPDFTRMMEQTGILRCPDPDDPDGY
jgi:hypothetical protein